MSRKIIVLLLCTIVLSLIIAGCDQASPPGKHEQQNEIQNGQAAEQQKDKSISPATTVNAKLYYATSDAMFLVPKTIVIGHDNAPATAVRMLLKGDETNNNVVRVIPPETKLLSLEIKDNIAYANFSKEIKHNPGGSTSERLIIGSIVNTLTEFQDIKRVKILIEGKSVETLNGHLDLSQPVVRDESLIKK